MKEALITAAKPELETVSPNHANLPIQVACTQQKLQPESADVPYNKKQTYRSEHNNSSTRHSNRMTYSMFDILFMYNTSLNQTRTEISTFLMSLHQAPLSSPPQRVHQALSLARGPEGQRPFPHLLCELMIHFLHL